MENFQPTVTVTDTDHPASVEEVQTSVTLENHTMVRMTRPGRVLRMENYRSVCRHESPHADRKAIPSPHSVPAQPGQQPMASITNPSSRSGIPSPRTGQTPDPSSWSDIPPPRTVQTSGTVNTNPSSRSGIPSPRTGQIPDPSSWSGIPSPRTGQTSDPSSWNGIPSPRIGQTPDPSSSSGIPSPRTGQTPDPSSSSGIPSPRTGQTPDPSSSSGIPSPRTGQTPDPSFWSGIPSPRTGQTSDPSLWNGIPSPRIGQTPDPTSSSGNPSPRTGQTLDPPSSGGIPSPRTGQAPDPSSMSGIPSPRTGQTPDPPYWNGIPSPRIGQTPDPSSWSGIPSPRTGQTPDQSSWSGIPSPRTGQAPNPSSMIGVPSPRTGQTPDPSSWSGIPSPHIGQTPDPSSWSGIPSPHTGQKPDPSSWSGIPSTRTAQTPDSFISNPSPCSGIPSSRTAKTAETSIASPSSGSYITSPGSAQSPEAFITNPFFGSDIPSPNTSSPHIQQGVVSVNSTGSYSTERTAVINTRHYVDNQLTPTHDPMKPFSYEEGQATCTQQIPKPNKSSPVGHQQIPVPRRTALFGDQRISVTGETDSFKYQQRYVPAGNGHSVDASPRINGMHIKTQNDDNSGIHGKQEFTVRTASSGVPKKPEIPKPPSHAGKCSAKLSVAPTKIEKPPSRRSEPVTQQNKSTDLNKSKVASKLMRSLSENRSEKPYVIHRKIKPDFLSPSTGPKSFQRSSRARSSDRSPHFHEIPGSTSTKKVLLRGSSLESESPPPERDKVEGRGAGRLVGRIPSFRGRGRPSSLSVSSAASSGWSDSPLSTPGHESPLSTLSTASPISDQILESTWIHREVNSTEPTEETDAVQMIKPIAKPNLLYKKDGGNTPNPASSKPTDNKKVSSASVQNNPGDSKAHKIPSNSRNAAGNPNVSPKPLRKFGGAMGTHTTRLSQRTGVPGRSQGKPSTEHGQKSTIPKIVDNSVSSNSTTERQSKISSVNRKTDNFNTFPKPKKIVSKKIISGSDDDSQNVIKIYPKYKPKPTIKKFTKQDVKGNSTPKMEDRQSVGLTLSVVHSPPTSIDRSENTRRSFIKPPRTIKPKQHSRTSSESTPQESDTDSDQTRLIDLKRGTVNSYPESSYGIKKPANYQTETRKPALPNPAKKNIVTGSTDRHDLTTPQSEFGRMDLDPEVYNRKATELAPQETYKVIAVLDIPDQRQWDCHSHPLPVQEKLANEKRISSTNMSDLNNNTGNLSKNLGKCKTNPPVERSHFGYKNKWAGSAKSTNIKTSSGSTDRVGPQNQRVPQYHRNDTSSQLMRDIKPNSDIGGRKKWSESVESTNVKSAGAFAERVGPQSPRDPKDYWKDTSSGIDHRQRVRDIKADPDIAGCNKWSESVESTNVQSSSRFAERVSPESQRDPRDDRYDTSGGINLRQLMRDIKADPEIGGYIIGPGVTLPCREDTPSPGCDDGISCDTFLEMGDDGTSNQHDARNHFVENDRWRQCTPDFESESDGTDCSVKTPPKRHKLDKRTQNFERNISSSKVSQRQKQSFMRVVEYNHTYGRRDNPTVIRKTVTTQSVGHRDVQSSALNDTRRHFERGTQQSTTSDCSADGYFSESSFSSPRAGSPDSVLRLAHILSSDSLSSSQDSGPVVWREVLVIKNLVMTACKRGRETLVRIDRLSHSTVDLNSAYHVAEGPFQGIVINNLAKSLPDVGQPDSQMEFMVHMANVQQKDQVQGTETRKVRFWFKPLADNSARSTNAKDYFKALLQPEHFPKDYVNFIKKAIVLAQHFPDVMRIELSLKPDTQQLQHESTVSSNIAPVQGKTPGVVPGVLQTNSGAQFTRKLEDEAVNDDDEDNEDIIENFITVLTPALYDYQYLPEVPVSNKSHVCFTVKAKCDAHIALSSVYGDTERKTYEIIIGAEDNTKSAIRDGGQGNVVEEACTLKIMDEDDSRAFWLSWDRGMVQVGEGRRRGLDTFLRWKVPPQKQHSVNCIAVSTGPGSKGQWEFVELIRPMKPEDTTKAARRARFRMSLLWLAKKERMLQVLEDAYPNSVHTAELLKQCNIKLHDMMTAVVFLKDLQKRNLITEVTKGIWMRCPGSTPDNSHVIKMVKEIPVLTGRETPTIAIITAMYCEKVAVDAMMENKVSYVQYKTEGDSQVYTIGRIGHNQVVSTKLSRVGSKSAAAISAGNTVTRLLGIFNNVEHVLMVGCGGAVPDYHDHDRHVRLGDIVVACPTHNNGSVYVHCDNMTKIQDDPEKYDFQTKSWVNKDTMLQSVVDQLKRHENSTRQPWARHMDEGNERLHSEESSFHRPSSKKDRLYAIIDNQSVQVEHPKPSNYRHLEPDNKSRLRYGPIGSSKYVARNDRIRLEFAAKTGVRAYDAEFGPVLDAIQGSQRNSYLLVRGIADYVDGTKNKEWQPYASLAAAAYVKAVISAMPTVRRGSNYK